MEELLAMYGALKEAKEAYETYQFYIGLLGSSPTPEDVIIGRLAELKQELEQLKDKLDALNNTLLQLVDQSQRQFFLNRLADIQAVHSQARTASDEAQEWLAGGRVNAQLIAQALDNSLQAANRMHDTTAFFTFPLTSGDVFDHRAALPTYLYTIVVRAGLVMVTQPGFSDDPQYLSEFAMHRARLDEIVRDIDDAISCTVTGRVDSGQWFFQYWCDDRITGYHDDERSSWRPGTQADLDDAIATLSLEVRSRARDAVRLTEVMQFRDNLAFDAAGRPPRAWTPWHVIPPSMAPSHPVVVGAGVVEFFWTDRDGSIRTVRYDPWVPARGWSAPTVLASQTRRLIEAIGVGDRVLLLWPAPDGSLVGAYDEHSGSALSVFPVGRGYFGSVCATATRTHIGVFWLELDGSIFGTWHDLGRPAPEWSGPSQILGPQTAQGQLRAVSHDGSAVSLFWCATDGAIVTAPIESGSGRVVSPPMAITAPGTLINLSDDDSRYRVVNTEVGLVDVCWVGRDSSVWVYTHNVAARAGGVRQVAPPREAAMWSRLSAVSSGPGNLDLFWIGNDSAVRSSFRDRSTADQRWVPPFSLGSPRRQADTRGHLVAISSLPEQIAVLMEGEDGGVQAIELPSLRRPGAATFAGARRTDHLDVFWARADGAAMTNWWHAAPGQRWEDHEPIPVTLPGAAPPGSAFSVVSRLPEQIDAFWVAGDGSIRSTWWNPDAAWGDVSTRPFSVAGPGSAHPGSALSAVGRRPDHLDVFWVRSDGAVMTNWWHAAPGAAWENHEPFPVAPPGSARPTPPAIATVSRHPEQIDVFWIAADGSVRSTWWNHDAGWGDIAERPFFVAGKGSAHPKSTISAVARRPDQLDAFWVGPDGAIITNWWHAAAGQAWENHSPFPVAAPGASSQTSPIVAAVSRTGEHLDVFWLGVDGSVKSTWWDAAAIDGWGDVRTRPFAIAGPRAARPENGQLSAVTRMPNQLDVFWCDPSGKMVSTWWHEAPGKDWHDHTPFPVGG